MAAQITVGLLIQKVIHGQTTPFGPWLMERRKVLDVTRMQLAVQIGCAQIMIEKIENGEHRPSKQIAELLADALHILDESRAVFVEFASGSGAPPDADVSTTHVRSATA